MENFIIIPGWFGSLGGERGGSTRRSSIHANNGLEGGGGTGGEGLYLQNNQGQVFLSQQQGFSESNQRIILAATSTVGPFHLDNSAGI